MTDTAAAAPAVTYREALRQAHREALLRDPRVFLMGEDVGRYGGAFGVSRGLLEEFGEERIRDAPLSELAFTGTGIGAAIGGMRPIVEVMTVNFALLALDQIVNNAATLLHMSGGQVSVPLVIRMATGGWRQLAAQHSHSLEGWFAHVPGLTVLAPATVEDARGMLWPALQDPDPVVILEHGGLLGATGPLADPPPEVDIRSAAVRRAGSDVTLIAYGGTPSPRKLTSARMPAGVCFRTNSSSWFFTFTGRMRTSHAIPAIPMPLLPAAPTIPLTIVPCEWWGDVRVPWSSWTNPTGVLDV